MINILELEDIIVSLSSPQLLESRELAEKETLLEQQCIHLKRHIIDKLVSSTNTGNLEIFVNVLSGSLSRLCNKLYELYKKVIGCRQIQNKSKLLPFYKKICDQLGQVLLLVRSLAPKIFDDNLPMPFAIYLVKRTMLKKQLRALDRIIPVLDANNAVIIPLIKKIVLDHLQTPSCLSFKMADYFEKVLERVSSLDEKPDADYNYLLHVRLIALNFNHPEYIEHCHGKLVEKFGELPPEKKLFAYRWYEMEIKRILPEKNAALYDHLPSAQEAIKVYVTEEILYLNYDAPTNSNDEKIATNLTSGELGLLFISFSRSGTIAENNVMKLMRLVVKYFSPKGAEQASRESVRSKGYNPTPETAVSLIKKLHDCINEIRSR